MLTVDGRTLELVQQKFAEQRLEALKTIEFGQPHVIGDYATYRQCVGFLSGLAYFDKALNEAREQANQEAGAPPKAA